MLPNVHNEYVFITAAINTSKNRDVIVLDIPGVFVHVLTKDKVVMLVTGINIIVGQ